MHIKQISNDDIEDVSQMSRKIEIALAEILSDNDMDLAFGALMTGTINSILCQCETWEEFVHYRDVFITVLKTTHTKIIKKPVS